MKKAFIIAFALIILVLVGIYIWGADNGLAPTDEPYIVGEIVAVSENRVLIAEAVEGEEYTGELDQLIGNAIWLSVDDDTELIGIDGETVSFDELTIGSRVEAWAYDEILLSYPAQGGARKILLIERQEEQEVIACYVGGCSGELCTNDPEVASTCELLPGMECLGTGMSCEAVAGDCTWILSEEAARCFMDVEREMGESVRETRIGYLFEKAEELLGEEY